MRDLRRIQKQFADGKNMDTIAEGLGVGRQTIFRALHRGVKGRDFRAVYGNSTGAAFTNNPKAT